MRQELRRGATGRRWRRGDGRPGRRWSGLVVAGVLVMAAVLVPGGRVWGERGAGGRVAHARAAVRAPEPGERDWTRAPSPQEPVVAGAAVRPQSGESGFSHRLHRGVQCTSCHSSASSHGALKVRTREDCRACHHSSTQATACTTCHTAGTLPPPSTRTVPVHTSVAPGVVTRTLPFGHSFHAGVACQDCHDASLEHRPIKDCSGCHARHHTPGRDCQRCHRPEDVKGHPASVHAGCGGGGCHTDAAVTSLTWSRTVCTTCHQDRAGHQPGRDCATCHQVPALHQNRKEVAQ